VKGLPRVDRGAWILLTIVVLASLAWTVHAGYDKATDAALYVSTARSIATGEGYSYLGVPFVVRPPGFAFLLAPLVGSEAPPDFRLLNGFVGLFGAAATFGLFALLKRRVGSALAAVAALTFWCNPFVQRVSSQVLSDMPGLALLLWALVLDRTARERDSWAWHVALGAVLAIGVYLRTLSLLLVPAILLGRLFEGREAAEPRTGARPRTGAAPLALALGLPVLAFAPWLVRSTSVDVPAPTEQVYVHSYATAMLHELPGDPSSPRLTAAQLIERCRTQSAQLIDAIGGRLGVVETGPSTKLVTVALVLLAIVGWWRRRDALSWLTGATLAVLATYFAFKLRLALPAWTLLGILAVDVLHDVGSSVVGRRTVRAALGIALAGLAVHDFEPWPWRTEAERRRDALVQVGRYLDEHVPPGAAVAAPIGFHVGIFANRPVYSLQIVAERAGPDAALALLAEHDVTHVVQDTRRTLNWSFERLGFTGELVGPFLVYRVP